MARSIKNGEKSIWVAFQHPVNKTLSVQGFSDRMESTNSWKTSTIVETAEQASEAFLKSMPGSKVMVGAKTAEEAIALASAK